MIMKSFIRVMILLAVLCVTISAMAESDLNSIVWLTEIPDSETRTDKQEDLTGDTAGAQTEDHDPPALVPVWGFPVSIDELLRDVTRLVNQTNLLESGYVPGDLVKLSVRKTSGTVMMREEAASALSQMFAAADRDGITLYAHSGYRSYQSQKTMYNNRLAKNNGKDDGYVAKPGTSDHQTGLGIDVISKAWIGKSFNSAFAATPESKWMEAHAADYGFIIRYPKDKETITLIAYEPWHLRYVGLPAARYITDTGITLEEFDALWRGLYEDYRGAALSPVNAAPEKDANGVYETDVRGTDGDTEFSIFKREDGSYR